MTSRGVLWTTAIALTATGCGWPARAAETAPPPPVIPIAHSALLSIDATITDDSLALHIRHAGNQIPIDGRDVTVSADGKEQPVTPQPEGTFLLDTKDLHGDGERQLNIVVAHDGIREVLTGKVTLPKVRKTDLWSNHKQMGWWILNIAIVLIAAFALSHRKSSSPKEESDPDD
jgi:hypothetical protein